MKKISKIIPLLFLSLPVLSGCGKSGPNFSGKGNEVTYEEFETKLLAAKVDAVWNKEDDLPSFEISEKSKKIIDKDNIIEGLPQTSKDKTKKKIVAKLDLGNNIGSTKQKSKQKIKTVSGKNSTDKQKIITKSKQTIENKILDDGSYEIRTYDHLNRIYNIATTVDSEGVKKYFQTSSKLMLKSAFDVSLTENYKEGNEDCYKFYVGEKDLVFTTIFEKTDVDTSIDGVSITTKDIVKKQLSLVGKTFKLKTYTFNETTTRYLKEVQFNNEGDRHSTFTTKTSEISCKFKNVKINETKDERYKLA